MGTNRANTKKSLSLITIATATTVGVIARALRKKAEKDSYTAELMEPIEQRKQGVYEKY